MAFSSILRRSASSFAPLAVRALRSQWNFHSAVFTALNQTSIVSGEPRLCPFLPPPRSYSSKRPRSDDENLLRLLDSEIQRAEEIPTVGEAPEGFPFEIDDELGFETVKLWREYQGEVIRVVLRTDLVCRPDDDDDDDDDGVANQASIPLVVTVAKEEGHIVKLECTFYPNEIKIGCLSAKDPEFSEEEIPCEGPHVQDSDDLQKAVRKFLEIRGINPSMTNFMREYLASKHRKHYLMHLKRLKRYVEA